MSTPNSKPMVTKLPPFKHQHLASIPEHPKSEAPSNSHVRSLTSQIMEYITLVAILILIFRYKVANHFPFTQSSLFSRENRRVRDIHFVGVYTCKTFRGASEWADWDSGMQVDSCFCCGQRHSQNGVDSWRIKWHYRKISVKDNGGHQINIFAFKCCTIHVCGIANGINKSCFTINTFFYHP